MSEEKNITQVHDEDSLDLEVLNVKEEALEKLSDVDREFFMMNKAVAIARAINALDTKIMYTCKAYREYFPDADIETIKIIGARIDDIDKKQISSISMGFIDSLLTVNGKKYELHLPGILNEKFKTQLEALSKIDYNRSLIECIKGTSDTLDDAAKKKDELTKVFEETVDDKFKEILASPDKIEEYTRNYYQAKIDDPNTDEVTRKNLEETKKWTDYGYNLEPIISTVRGILQEKGTTSSVMYGYKNRASKIFAAAMQVCSKHQISFPIQALNGIEEYLLGEKYKDKNHLFAYLLAWYIKYRSASMSKYEKIFITQTLCIVVEITQHKKDAKENNPTNEIKEKFAPFLKQLIDLVVDNCH